MTFCFVFENFVNKKPTDSGDIPIPVSLMANHKSVSVFMKGRYFCVSLVVRVVLSHYQDNWGYVVV